MHPMKLSGVPTIMAERTCGGPVVAIDNPDDVVPPVSDEQVSLLGIAGHADGPGRAVPQCLRADKEFLNEFAVFGKNLDPVRGSIADIDESIGRQPDAVNRTEELF